MGDGNIGLPVLTALAEREAAGQQPDVWVVELSSFQLETTVSLRADAATVLNISEDHLDRYHDLLDYAHSKTAIFAGNGVQVLNRDDVPAETVATERRIAEETAKNEGKPEAALPKIVEGRVNGFFKENVLLEQDFAKDNKFTVAQVLDKAGVKVSTFVRFRVGA